jgi:hypothetical protein
MVRSLDRMCIVGNDNTIVIVSIVSIFKFYSYCVIQISFICE